MTQIEKSENLPEIGRLKQEIKEDDLGDEFGEKVMALADEVLKSESKGEMAGWATRLLLYEMHRRRAWFEMVFEMAGGVGPALEKRQLQKISPRELVRTAGPGVYLPWEKMLEKIRGKTVRWENGSYRAVPTPATVDYLREGFSEYLGGDVSVVAFEPAENIAVYKKPGLLIFPDNLRAELLRHIPTVNIVTRVPEFGSVTPRVFWQMTYAELMTWTANLEILYSEPSVNDPLAYIRAMSGPWRKEAISAGGFRPTGSLDREYRKYLYLTTGEWDKVCSGHEKFIKLASKYLLDE